MINIQLNEFSARDPATQLQDEEEEKHIVNQDSYHSDSETNKLNASTLTVTNSGPLRVWKALLKEQHPWSVSDPGPPSFSILEVSDQKYSSSSPLLKGEQFSQQKQTTSSISIHQGSYQPQLPKESSPRKLGINKASFLKWTFIVLNVFLETCQAVLTQEMNQHKSGRHIYLKLSIFTSSICVIVAFFEACHAGWGKGVVCKNKGGCCWLYYHGPQGRLFGKFSIYFAIVCSTFQLIINMITYITGKSVIKFDYVPLFLSVGYLLAAIFGSPEKAVIRSVAMVKCRTHGCSVAEKASTEDRDGDGDGDGDWVLECRQCQMENV